MVNLYHTDFWFIVKFPVICSPLWIKKPWLQEKNPGWNLQYWITNLWNDTVGQVHSSPCLLSNDWLLLIVSSKLFLNGIKSCAELAGFISCSPFLLFFQSGAGLLLKCAFILRQMEMELRGTHLVPFSFILQQTGMNRKLLGIPFMLFII